MRKKLVASKAEVAPFEITVDDQPAPAGVDMGLDRSLDESNDEAIPSEVYLAVAQGKVDEAKRLLEKAGYQVTLMDIGQSALSTD